MIRKPDVRNMAAEIIDTIDYSLSSPESMRAVSLAVQHIMEKVDSALEDIVDQLNEELENMRDERDG